MPSLRLSASILWTFLGFGVRAFGGPVAQIAELESDFVERRGWVERDRFRRALAVYQLLPGPEAHEMCCYLGAVRGGWLGSIAAGLGFMLPGLALMLCACALYASLDLSSPVASHALAAMQLVAAALIVRAAWRLLAPIVRWKDRSARLPCVTALAACALSIWWFAPGGDAVAAPVVAVRDVQAPGLFAHGFVAGAVTFGGAYTAIPYVASVATGPDGWMTQGAFLDGVAIASVLPAPLVIFGTFVGYQGGGLLGALAFTVGIFLPAFAFTVFGFAAIERLVAWTPARRTLDVAGAIAVGIMVGAAFHIVSDAATGWMKRPMPFGSATPFLLATFVYAIWVSKARLAAPIIVIVAGAVGALYGALR
jgi:chromate transporter